MFLAIFKGFLVGEALADADAEEDEDAGLKLNIAFATFLVCFLSKSKLMSSFFFMGLERFTPLFISFMKFLIS
jgi:hypothetical protein